MSVESENQVSGTPLVQNEAVTAAPIISFVMVVLILLGGLTFSATYWFKSEVERIELMRADQSSYPDLVRLQVSGRQQLNRYEMLEEGIFRIPVEQAIERLALEFPETVRISEEMLP